MSTLTAGQIERQVRALLAVALGLPVSRLTGAVRQDQFSEWTSLNHLALLLAIEEEFALTLTAGEMTAMTSLERIVETIGRHTGGRDPGNAILDASLAAFESQFAISPVQTRPPGEEPAAVTSPWPEQPDTQSSVAAPRAAHPVSQPAASAPPQSGVGKLSKYVRSPRATLHKGREWLSARWQLRSCQSVGQFARVVGSIRVNNWGAMIVGNRVVFLAEHARSLFTTFEGGRLTIGDNTTINYGVDIAATGSITIGANVMIGTYVSILDNDFHGLEARDTMPKPRPVILEDNVWIGNRAIIMPGVTIGEGAAVGAGSVVITDVPPRTLAMGNPARIVRQF